MESTTDYTFTPCVGYFTSPGRHQIEVNDGFSVSSERHRDTQPLMLRATFVHLTNMPGLSGDRTRRAKMTC